MLPASDVDPTWLSQVLGRAFVAFIILGAIYSAAVAAALRRWGPRAAWFAVPLFALAFTAVFGAAAARNPGVRPTAVSVSAIGLVFVAVPAAITTFILTRAARRPAPPTLRSQFLRGILTFVLTLPLGFIAGALVDVLSYAMAAQPSRPAG